MEILIDANQWPMAAGCIGLSKLFPEEIEYTSNGIVLTDKLLDSLAEKYVHSLINMFSVVERDVKRFGWYAAQTKKNPDQTKQYAIELSKNIREQLKKVEKYFPETEECRQLKKLVETLKEVTDKKESQFIQEAIDQYEQIMEKPFINDKLSLNLAKSEALIPFFGQTSILQKTFYSKDTEEHIQRIKEDFIYPAKLEIQFVEKLNNAKDFKEILDFLDEHKKYKPFNNLLKKIKKKKSLEELKVVLETEVLQCSFIDGFIATQTFEEMIFSPLAFSNNKAVNFYWNFENQLPVPISAIARLILFIAPLGMAFYPRKLGNVYASESLRFSGLILSQKHFSEIVKDNITYQTFRRKGSSFEEAIVGFLHETLDKAKKIQHSYFFIEVYSNYDMKKTLLDYYHMPPYLVAYLSQYGDSLKMLMHKDLKDEYLRTILKGIDPKHILFDYLLEAIKKPNHARGSYFAARERVRILEAKKGEEKMDSNDKLIYLVYRRGIDLRNAYVRDGNENTEGALYRASGKKKLEGIAYRLLNAAKAGNKNAFMDTIFRVHMAADLDVPSIFIDSFKKEGLDFETIASVFIAGMLSEEKGN